jgi:copper resistance protein D
MISRWIVRFSELLLLIFVSLLLQTPASTQHDHMDGMQHQQNLSDTMRVKLLNDKRESEFNHHLAGFFLILAGALILMQDSLSRRIPIVKYLWPVCFLLAGLFVLVFSDTELWPFGNQNWFHAMSTDLEVLQHKVFSIILLGLGVIELLRIRGTLTVAWTAWIFPVGALFGAVMLLFHSHQAGMHGADAMVTMEHIQIQHQWYAILGFGIAVTKGLADTLKNQRLLMKIWPTLLIVLGISLMLYTE